MSQHVQGASLTVQASPEPATTDAETSVTVTRVAVRARTAVCKWLEEPP